MGQLNHKRRAHNAINCGEMFIVVGGFGTQTSEKCVLTGNNITCTDQTPELQNFALWPELLEVGIDFCNTNKI